MKALLLLLVAVLLSTCTTHPPTKAGYTSKRGADNVRAADKEKRHF